MKSARYRVWDSSIPGRNGMLMASRKDLIRLLYKLNVWKAIRKGSHAYQTYYEVVLEEGVKWP